MMAIAEVVVRSDPNMLAEEEDSPPIDIAVAPKTKDIPMHASFEIGFDIPGPGEKHPIHESIAIAAFIRSELKFPRATTYNNLNHKQWEYFRGMIWNDDPDCLLFDDSASDNRDFGLGAEWWKEFKTGSENRMTRRSHFGDLQFLHAMGSRERELPHYTRDRLLQWMGVMYRLACGDQGISEHHKLGDHFGPEYFDHSTIPSNDRSFRELILATTPNYRASNVAQRALGVCMHMIGDSYAVGHVQRRLKNPGDFAGRDRDGYLNFKAGTWGQWGPIVSFHTYGNQKESRHSFYDGLEGADLPNPKDLGSYNRLHGARDAIEGCILLMNAFARKQPWDELRKKLEEGIFAIDEHAKPCNADVDGKVPGLDFASAMEPVQPSQYYDDAAYMRKLSALESNSQTTPDLRQGTNKFWLRLDVGLRSLFLILLGIIAISFLVFSTLLQK